MTSVVILAGGLATRIRPLTEQFPKALISIHGHPFLRFQLLLLKKYGFTDVVLSVGYEGQQIEEVFGNGSSLGIKLRYSYDGDFLLGTGGAIQKALPLLSDPFLVLYGDSYLDIDYGAVLNSFFRSEDSLEYPLGLMTVYRNDHQWDQSNVVFHDSWVQCYHKREPSPDMHHIDWGLGILSQEAFLPFQFESIFDLASVYEKLAIDRRLKGYEVFQRFYEIGSFEGIEALKVHLQGNDA